MCPGVHLPGPPTARRSGCAQANSSRLAEDVDACHGMNFIPSAITVGDVGARHADTIAGIGNPDLRMESAACVFVGGIGWSVLADYLHHRLATCVQQLHQISYRLVFAIEGDLQIAVPRWAE